MATTWDMDKQTNMSTEVTKYTYLIISPDPKGNSHIRWQPGHVATCEQHWVKIGDEGAPEGRLPDYKTMNPGCWILPIQVKNFAPQGSGGKLGTVLRKKVFEGRTYAIAEGTTEWCLVENKTAALANLQSTLSGQGDTWVVNNVEDAAAFLRQYI